MADADTLAYFDKTASTKIVADANLFFLGAVLLQKWEGELLPVYSASRDLTDCEHK